MTYLEQLKTREWNDKRTEILIRDHFKCQHPDCSVQFYGVEVHHRDYIDEINAWEYPNDMLVTWCRDHHQEYHDSIKKVEKQLSFTLKMKGFMLGDLLGLSCLIDTDQMFTESLLKTLRDEQNG